MKTKILIVAAAFLFLGGCGYKDIDRRFFVVSIGVDKSDDKENMYDITLKVAVPTSETKTGSNESRMMTESAETISEAVRIIKSKVEKELDFSHTKMIVLGEKVVEDDLTNILDWFYRRRDIQAIAWTAVGSPTALSVLEAKPSGERVPSNALFLSFGNVGTETPYVTSVYIFDFRRRQTERGIDPFLPIIKTEEEAFSINNTSLISDMKQVLILSAEETKYFNMLRNRASKFDIKVEKEEKPYFLFSTDKIKASFDLKSEKSNRPVISYDVQLSGIVEEAFETLDEAKANEYEKAVKIEVEEQINSLLKKLQKEEVDPLGFGLRYRATKTGKESNKVEKWDEIYPNAQFKVKVSVDMKNVGIIHDQEGHPE
ncbi:Ger(x)C family spore germination protein [Metabacillus litoralis]|uniref:Ger(x)C family spore germination protein n=1 Tax=Metabacillus litoralis TaxID=152268 RepID=UPI0013CEBB7F|nr:Ger(x)C family spore germination protein [Metabacillus litoralis]MCM3160117.1 Ger(x)C family spore germination protein [Metabacillus litoralis]MCM3408702.1 Ger(x)C family spore germination protein [Metabacillus litoralis]